MEDRKISVVNFLLLFVAGVINATGVTLLLAPLELLDTGISGTAFLLDSITPVTMGIYLFVLNVPFYLFAAKKLGKEFVIYSLFAITVYSLFAVLFRDLLPIDFSNGSPFAGSDMLLAALFGGLLSGIGSGMVIRFGGAIDGVEVLAVLFSKRLGLTVGSFVMCYNVVIYTLSALIFHSWLVPLYSIIAYTVCNKTIDFVVEGFDKAKAVFIITERGGDIQNHLTEALGRGVTTLDAHGVYSNECKTLVYCVANRFEIHRIKTIVKESDISAFVTISDVSETVGGIEMGFQMQNPRGRGSRSALPSDGDDTSVTVQAPEALQQILVQDPQEILKTTESGRKIE